MNSNFSKHPIFTQAQAMADICKPLQHLNIHNFCHVRISNDEKRTWLATCPEFTTHYLNKKYHEVDIHSANSQFGEVIISDNLTYRGETKRLIQDAADFGLKQFFNIVEKDNDAVNYYHFSTNESSKEMSQIYLNNFDSLKFFIRYFNDTVVGSKELSAMKNFELSAGNKHDNCEFIFDDLSIDVASFESEMKKRLLKIKDNFHLSEQQKKCLHYLSLGYSAKEIALQLNISYRTVESYLEIVRNKLQFRNSKAMIAWYSQAFKKPN